MPRVAKRGVRVEIHERPSLDRIDACLTRGDYPVVKHYLYNVILYWAVLVGRNQGTYYMRDPLINEPTAVPLTRQTSRIHAVHCIGKPNPGAA